MSDETWDVCQGSLVLQGIFLRFKKSRKSQSNFSVISPWVVSHYVLLSQQDHLTVETLDEWVKSSCFAKSLNCWLVYCLPLSVMSVCGAPLLWLSDREGWSQSILNRNLHGPGIVFHARWKFREVCRGSVCWCALVLLHTVQECSFSAMSFDIASQKMKPLALHLVASMPRWPLWTILVYSLCRNWGIFNSILFWIL